MITNPKISVIIPTYNRPEFLPRAIQSVLEQTFQDFEIIVVDDGTERRANQIIEKINDNRIVYIQHQENKGASVARNTGIKNVQGDLIAFLDDDDCYYQDFLEKMRLIFEQHKEVKFSFCSSLNCKEKSDDCWVESTSYKTGVGNFFEDFLSFKIRTTTSCLVVKREILALNQIFFDPSLFVAHELDLLLRISQKYKGFASNKILVQRCIFEKGSLGRDTQKKCQDREMLLEKYKEDFEKRPLILSKHLMSLANLYCDNRQYKKAQKIFKTIYQTQWRWKPFLYYLSMFREGLVCRIFRKLKEKLFLNKD